MAGTSLLEGALRALASTAGCGAIWKTASGETASSLPTEVQLHGEPFCIVVKSIESAMPRCRLDDVERVRGRVGSRKGFHLKRCHAGVVELVVPVTVDGLCAGSWQFGPWRAVGTACVYARCRELHARLPWFDRRRALTLVRIARALTPPFPTMPGPSPRSSSAALDRAVSFVNEHAADPLTRDRVAAAAFVSPSRLSHLFREHLHLSLSDYIASCRMARARALLANTPLKLGEVAARVGYDNHSHFAALFRRETGCTPKEFRRRAWESRDV